MEDGTEEREASHPPRRGPGPALVPMAGVFYALVFGAALIWGAIEGRAPVRAPGAREVDWLPDAGLGLVAGLGLLLVSDLTTRLTRWGARTARMLGELLGPVSTGDALWLALLSAIAEELLFRGALQPHLGLVGASLVFGLAHLAPRRELLPWTGMAIVAGLALGALFESTGNVLAPIVAHFVVNAVNLRVLSQRFGEPAGGDPDDR